MQHPLSLHSSRQAWLRHFVKLGLDVLLGVLGWGTALVVNPESPLTFRSFVGWGLTVLAASALFQVFRQHYRVIGFRDFLRITLAMGAVLVSGIFLRFLLATPAAPFSLWVLATLLTGLYWFVFRALFRLREEFLSYGDSPEALNTLVIGAGRAGLLVADELHRHPELGCRVLGFLDDDLNKQGIRVRGIPVLGTQELLGPMAEAHAIEQVVLAIPSASGAEIRRLAERAQGLGLKVKTVPGLFNLLGGLTWKPEIRDVSIEDLLRREPIQLDQAELKCIVEDQTVLVTGAGGSIGGELVRQLCALRPGRVVLLGRGENSLWQIERELRRTFPNQPISLELCDIRNPRRLGQSFERWQPTIVFHAAAHKHVPFLEQHPLEAVENNIFGTRNVLEAAIENEVRHFVNISTDKAVNPTNVLGASKFVAEMLVAEAAGRTPGGSKYVSVRFGNVLGSRGSVVPIFREQLQAGGPLTVTHPDMTRYFMTIPEASQLVIQAGLLGDTGHVYALDMGEPVRILDLAKDMIRLSGLEVDKEIEIQFSGIRPGEKLFEELFYGDSAPSAVHAKVFEAQLDVARLQDLAQRLQELEAQSDHLPGLMRLLCDLVPSYQPSASGAGKWLTTPGH